MIPDAIKNFIDRFSKLPSLGPRAATRLAFYLIHLDKNELKNLDLAFSGLKHLGRCPRCFFIKTSGGPCSICNNPKRDKSSIAIVEKETDLLAIEKSGRWMGWYLVLGELDNRGTLETAQKLRLEHLKKIIKEELAGKAKEIMVALNPNALGDFIYETVKAEFKDLAERITRLGRGIPTGGEIEFADEETLTSSLERRL